MVFRRGRNEGGNEPDSTRRIPSSKLSLFSAKTGAMRAFPAPTRAISLALVVLMAVAGCSAEARKNRHLGRAEKYFEAGEFEKAKLEYLTVIRADQKNAKAFQRMAAIWLSQGSPMRAGGFLARTRELAPNDIDNRVNLARVYVSVNALAEARKEALAVLAEAPANGEALLILAEASRNADDLAAFDQALQKFPDHNTVAFHLATATLALRKNDLPSAEQSFQRAATADPKSSLAHAGLAALSLLKKDNTHAAEELRTAAELAPLRSNERIQYAEFLAQTGATAEAKESLKALTAKAPDYLPAWRLLAQIAFIEKKYDESLALLEKIFALDPDNLDARMVEVQVRTAQGDAAKALEQLQHLDKTYANVPTIKLQLARAYLLNNNPTDAAATLNKTIATYPEFLEAKLLLGDINLRTGEAAQVVTAMTELLKSRPGTIPAQMLLADAYRLQGRLDDAANVFREQLKVSPESVPANLALGVILRQQQKTAEARKAFEKVLEVSPSDAVAAGQLVELDIGDKAFDVAMTRARAQLEATSGSAGAHVLEGKVFAAQGQLDQAEAAFAKALEVDAKFSPAYDLLINTYIAENKLPQAAEQLEGLLAKKSDNTAALMALALIRDKMGEFSKAAETYEKLVAIKPDFAPAFNNLAYLYAEKLNQLDKAAEAARRARSLQPADPSIADTLGWILYRQGDYQQARSLLEESAVKLGDNPEVQFHLGSARSMMGQTALARTALQKAAEATTDFPGKDEARHRLELLGDGSAGSTEMPIADLEALTKQQPNDVVALTRLGEAYRKASQFPKAAAAFEQVIKINPRLVSPTVELAQIYAGPLQNKEKALELAKKARELAPNDPKVAGMVGTLAYQSGNFLWSYSLLQEAARRLPDDATVQHDYAWAAYSLGRVKEAQQVMQRVVTTFGNTPEALDGGSFLAMIALEQTPNESAQTPEVQKLLSTNPDYVPALMVQGSALRRSRDVKSAEKIYQRVLERFPDFAPAQKQLAAIYSVDPANPKRPLIWPQKPARLCLTIASLHGP